MGGTAAHQLKTTALRRAGGSHHERILAPAHPTPHGDSSREDYCARGAFGAATTGCEAADAALSAMPALPGVAEPIDAHAPTVIRVAAAISANRLCSVFISVSSFIVR